MRMYDDSDACDDTECGWPKYGEHSTNRMRVRGWVSELSILKVVYNTLRAYTTPIHLKYSCRLVYIGCIIVT